MVLGRDLNPHDTLFAGQATSYMIECAFLAVHDFLQTPHIVCAGLDGLRFLRPVHKGASIDVESTIIFAGRASVGAYIRLSLLPERQKAAECFLSFVHIDEASGNALPHYVHLAELADGEQALQRQYLKLKECRL
jgi:acyl-CoA hydrolase